MLAHNPTLRIVANCRDKKKNVHEGTYNNTYAYIVRSIPTARRTSSRSPL